MPRLTSIAITAYPFSDNPPRQRTHRLPIRGEAMHHHRAAGRSATGFANRDCKMDPPPADKPSPVPSPGSITERMARTTILARRAAAQLR